MQAFRPQLLSQDKIRAMLAEISPEESRQARKHSLMPLKSQILFGSGMPPAGATWSRSNRPWSSRKSNSIELWT